MLVKLGEKVNINVQSEASIKNIVEEVKSGRSDFSNGLSQLTEYLESRLYDGEMAVFPMLLIELNMQRGKE